MERVIAILVSRQGRLMTGLAAMGALAVGLWPWVPAEASPPKIVAFVLALAAWLFAELAGGIGPHPHDVDLFRLLQRSIPEAERQRLREHDMGNPFRSDAFDGVFEISDSWTGARWEFIDPVLNKRWLEVLGKIREFVHAVSVHTFPSHFNANLQTVRTLQEEMSGVRNDVSVANARELNRLSSELSKLLDGFDRLAAANLRTSLH